MDIAKNFLKLKKNILDLFFPIECLKCGKEGSWLCKNCFRNLEINYNQYCMHCKEANEFGQFCKKCSTEYALNGIWIAGDYENKIIASLIKNLKYKFTKDASEILGNFLSLFLHNLINKNKIKQIDLSSKISLEKIKAIKKSPKILFNLNNTIIIPVPLHKKREKWRGFNQSREIAKVLSENFNLKIHENLIRVKHKKPQAKLGESQRKKNILDCFRWEGNQLQNYDIILIDDVVTTGSTLNECAKTLRKAGAGEIWGLVIAKG